MRLPANDDGLTLDMFEDELRELIAIQSTMLENQYSIGVYNGLLLALQALTGEDQVLLNLN